MILIIGSNHDDVLYYETLLKDSHRENILNKYNAMIGTIGSSEVMVIQDIYTSVISSLIVNHIITKYVINLVISVGRCEIIKGEMRIGDVAVSESVLFADIDQLCLDSNLDIGEIPGFPNRFLSRLEMLNTMNNCLDSVMCYMHYNATYLSSSFFRMNKEKIEDVRDNEYLASFNENMVLDGESAGIALACYLHDVPMISVKICEAYVGEYTTLEHYLEIIKEYASLGKAVAVFISEISRTDVLRT